MKNSRQEELKQVYYSIDEWIKEFPIEWRKQKRAEYLKAEIQKTKNKFFEACVEVSKRKDNLTYWSEKNLKRLEKKLRKLNMQVGVLYGKEQDITPEKIARAREYPITDLIEHKNYFARCPFHNEKTASMYLKKNFYHCFGCGENGDTIDLMQKLHGLTFKQAVDKLLR